VLVASMLVSLVVSTALPEAFGAGGLAVAGGYVLMQVGRTAFVVFAGRGRPLARIFTRILVWSLASGCFWLAGAFASGHARELLWLAGLAIDVCGGTAGFYVPGMGRTTSRDWTIEGGHFAERCQAFVIIALGESVVVTGATFAGEGEHGAARVAAFVLAFAGCVALWWVYFDRSAEEGARVIARHRDPGRLALFAYHLVHPIMIAGIVVTAAADERVLEHPGAVGDAGTSWLVLGGVGLFLAGHAAFKAVMWRLVPWTRLAALVALALLAALAPSVSALVLALLTVVVVAAVAVGDRLLHRSETSETETPVAPLAR
jgi:low temperature requirement protein LtrA